MDSEAMWKQIAKLKAARLREDLRRNMTTPLVACLPPPGSDRQWLTEYAKTAVRMFSGKVRP